MVGSGRMVDGKSLDGILTIYPNLFHFFLRFETSVWKDKRISLPPGKGGKKTALPQMDAAAIFDCNRLDNSFIKLISNPSQKARFCRALHRARFHWPAAARGSPPTPLAPPFPVCAPPFLCPFSPSPCRRPGHSPWPGPRARGTIDLGASLGREKRPWKVNPLATFGNGRLMVHEMKIH